MNPNKISNLERIEAFAVRSPARTAVRHVDPRGKETCRSYADLWRDVVSAGAFLQDAGIAAGDVVGLQVRNGLTHVVYSLATWLLRATLLPLDPDLPADRIDALRRTVPALVVVGDGTADVVAQWPVEHRSTQFRLSGLAPRFARSTGGSTGDPSVGVARNPAWVTRRDHLLEDSYAGVDTDLADLGVAGGQVQLVVLPQHHAGFTCLHYGLALGHEIVLVDQFRAQQSIELIKELGVGFLRIVPTQMRMILQVPGVDERVFASIQAVHHGAGPCTDSVKRDWLSLVGPERLYETYTTAEALFHLAVRGDDWLEDPGMIGHPRPGCAVVVNESGELCRPEEEGDVYLKSPTTALAYEHLGTPRQLRSWGEHVSVGDRGYLSAAGNLHLTGRSGQVLLVGGVNVNAGRVERILLGLEGIEDVVVIGRPDPLLGQSVHAVVVPADGYGFDAARFQRQCRRVLSPSEVPVSTEVRASLHRNASGKVARAGFA